MKTAQINYTTRAIELACQMVENGLCEFTVHGGVYSCVKDFSIDLMVPKWTESGTHFKLSLDFDTDVVGENKQCIQTMESILKEGFESLPEFTGSKENQIKKKKEKIALLQKELYDLSA